MSERTFLRIFKTMLQNLSEICTPTVDPDLHFKCGSRARNSNECRSMRIRIRNPDGEIPGRKEAVGAFNNTVPMLYRVAVRNNFMRIRIRMIS
jgi:hypothetical protein